MRKASYAGAAVLVTGLLVLIFVVLVFRFDEGTYQIRSARSIHLHQLIDVTEDTLSALKDAETGQRGYLVTGNPDYLEPYREGARAYHENAVRLGTLTENDQILAPLVPKLIDTGQSKLNELALVISEFDAGRRVDAFARVRTDAGKKLMDQARAATAQLLRLEEAEFAKTNRSIDRVVRRTGYSFFGASAGLFVLTFLGTVLQTFETRRKGQLARHLETSERRYRDLAQNLEDRVNERTLSLQNVNSALQSFSYSVSHDLRAPLRSIDGFSLMVLEDYADRLDDSAIDMLNRIRGAAGRMGRLIQSLLDLARFTGSEMHRETVSISSVAESVLEQLAAASPERKAEFTVAPHLQASADPQLIRVVLDNLLGNAWKFTSRNAVTRIEVGQQKDGAEDVFFVRDNGAGFDSSFADRLFTPFQRLHSDSEFEGTGIGLATVRMIIDRHDGRIWAESKLREGSTFYFTL